MTAEWITTTIGARTAKVRTPTQIGITEVRFPAEPMSDQTTQTDVQTVSQLEAGDVLADELVSKRGMCEDDEIPAVIRDPNKRKKAVLMGSDGAFAYAVNPNEGTKPDGSQLDWTVEDAGELNPVGGVPDYWAGADSDEIVRWTFENVRVRDVNRDWRNDILTVEIFGEDEVGYQSIDFEFV